MIHAHAYIYCLGKGGCDANIRDSKFPRWWRHISIGCPRLPQAQHLEHAMMMATTGKPVLLNEYRGRSKRLKSKGCCSFCSTPRG